MVGVPSAYGALEKGDQPPARKTPPGGTGPVIAPREPPKSGPPAEDPVCAEPAIGGSVFATRAGDAAGRIHLPCTRETLLPAYDTLVVLTPAGATIDRRRYFM